MAIKYKRNVIRIKNPSTGEWEPIILLDNPSSSPTNSNAMPLIEDADGAKYKLGMDENGIYAIKVSEGGVVTLSLTDRDTGVYAVTDDETHNVSGAVVADSDGDGVYEFEII